MTITLVDGANGKAIKVEATNVSAGNLFVVDSPKPMSPAGNPPYIYQCGAGVVALCQTLVRKPDDLRELFPEGRVTVKLLKPGESRAWNVDVSSLGGERVAYRGTKELWSSTGAGHPPTRVMAFVGCWTEQVVRAVPPTVGYTDSPPANDPSKIMILPDQEVPLPALSDPELAEGVKKTIIDTRETGADTTVIGVQVIVASNSLVVP